MTTLFRKYLIVARKNLGFLSGFLHLGSIQASNAIIQLLLFPLIIHVTGLEVFGIVMVANSYASLNAIFINYGTNQSGIKEVALHKNSARKLSNIFYTVYYARILLFLAAMLVLFVLYQCKIPHVNYFPFAITIIFAEVVNPFFFFAGTEKVYLFNVANLISKSLSALLIYFLITTPELGAWINFLLGIVNIGAYLLLAIYIIKKYRLTYYMVSRNHLSNFFKQNFYLVGNNVSSQLQQSVFLFALSFTGNNLLLGAYSFCDKIVWSFRMLIVAFTTAIYPRAAIMYKESVERWYQFRKRINILLAICFCLAALGILFFAPLVVELFTKTTNELAISYTRAICLVPLIASLNAMNVVDLLLKNKYKYIFVIAMILLAIAITVSFLFLTLNNSNLFGYYQIIVEVFSLPLYLYFMRKTERDKDAT